MEKSIRSKSSKFEKVIHKFGPEGRDACWKALRNSLDWSTEWSDLKPPSNSQVTVPLHQLRRSSSSELGESVCNIMQKEDLTTPVPSKQLLKSPPRIERRSAKLRHCSESTDKLRHELRFSSPTRRYSAGIEVEPPSNSQVTVPLHQLRRSSSSEFGESVCNNVQKEDLTTPAPSKQLLKSPPRIERRSAKLRHCSETTDKPRHELRFSSPTRRYSAEIEVELKPFLTVDHKDLEELCEDVVSAPVEDIPRLKQEQLSPLPSPPLSSINIADDEKFESASLPLKFVRQTPLPFSDSNDDNEQRGRKSEESLSADESQAGTADKLSLSEYDVKIRERDDNIVSFCKSFLRVLMIIIMLRVFF